MPSNFKGYVVTIPDDSGKTEAFQTLEEALSYSQSCRKDCKYPEAIGIHMATINFGDWSWI